MTPPKGEDNFPALLIPNFSQSEPRQNGLVGSTGVIWRLLFNNQYMIFLPLSQIQIIC